tara:strand:+ start:84 stop:380 length:297 start_codon:yes stop_codon:yes gene_type:complete
MTNFSKKFCAKSPFKDRRTKTDESGKTVDVAHDHNNSGKMYGEKGHTGETAFNKKFPGWLQSLIRISPKSSTKNVAKGGKKNNQPYKSDGTPNPDYVS